MASASDKISRTSDGGVPAPATVQTDRAAGNNTLALDTTLHWPTPTGIKLSTWTVDATTQKIMSGTQQDFAGVVTGSTVTGLRKTSAGADAGNLENDICIMMPTAAWADEFAQAFLQEHSNPNGAHGDVHATSVAVAGPVTATSVSTTTLTVNGNDIANLTPSGIINMFAGTTAPTGWLFCTGQAVSRSTYSALFAAIGTSYGVGNGTTTFNLPDFRGRSAFGLDATQGEFAALGQTGGQKSVQAHNHGVNDPGHSHNLTLPTVVANGGSGLNYAGGGSVWHYLDYNQDIGSRGTGISIQSAGSGSNNLNPYETVNFIIKA